MPWIPIVPTKSNPPQASDPAPTNPSEQKHSATEEVAKNIEESERISQKTNSKKFCVSVSRSEMMRTIHSGFTSFDHQVAKENLNNTGDRDEPRMTSSTIKSMSGVKIVALQTPTDHPCDERLSPSKHDTRFKDDDVSRSAQRKSSFRLPLNFDLDSDSDAHTESNRDSIPGRLFACSLEKGAHDANAAPDAMMIEAQGGSQGRVTRRKLLGRLAIEVVGIVFHKAAASQPRNAGDVVYLVSLPFVYSPTINIIETIADARDRGDIGAVIAPFATLTVRHGQVREPGNKVSDSRTFTVN